MKSKRPTARAKRIVSRYPAAASRKNSSLRSSHKIDRAKFPSAASIFWADERCVPPTDPESNFKLANELLFAPLKISEMQIHRLHGELPSAEAVKIAEAELRKFAKAENDLPVLDLIFLGMGEDGHVASLFPNASRETLTNVVPFLGITNSPKPPPLRITLSYAAIKAAKAAWVLASGDGKELALRQSLKPDGQTPLARVIHLREKTNVFSDIRLD